MVAKPLAMVMNHEEEEQDEEEMMKDENEDDEAPGSKINFILVLELLKLILTNQEVWSKALSELYPRNESEMSRLPPLECNDDKLKAELLQQIETLKGHTVLQGIADEISQRLPFIVRYNVLSVETCPELLSYPNGHIALGGSGLYHEPSFFNHNSRPNVARWAVGDVMFFVANQDIAARAEACISYIEHDVLCESDYRRNLVLQMNFQDGSGDTANEEEKDGPEMPVVDSEVQNELMATPPFDRLNDIEQLLLQAKGEAPPDEQEDNEEAMEESQPQWFQVDTQNLRILKAITLDGLGQSAKALPLWEECVEFSEKQLPPLDENSVVMRVQAALCAWHLGEKDKAKQHAQKALATHDKLFGGGSQRLRLRYRRDFELALRKTSDGVEALWPLSK